MKAKPVKDLRQPAYPTRREMLAGAVSFLLLNTFASEGAPDDGKKDEIIVAPIFEHGTGRGATGCVVIVPPVFLSEEEGMQIIREELASHGVVLERGTVLHGAVVPHRFLTGWDEGRIWQDDAKQVVESKKRAKPLRLDGIDSEKKIAVAFVSKREYFDWGGIQESYSSEALEDASKQTDEFGEVTSWRVSSSAQSYDFKEAARFVADQVEKHTKESMYLGLFYNPMQEAPRTTDAKGNDEMKFREALGIDKPWEARKDDTKVLLRKQAQDFVDWLKREKAIP